MNKIISDGTHIQCCGSHKDHNLWVQGILKKVNTSKSLNDDDGGGDDDDNGDIEL